MRYTREDGCLAWLAYGQTRPGTLSDILDAFSSAEQVYDQFVKSKGRCLKDYLAPAQVDLLREQAEPDAMHRMMVVMQREKMGIMGRDDLRYPEALRNLDDPPPLLFYQGDPDCLMGKCVSIIGTRKAAPNTIDATERIARDLSNAGVTVVSGLAMGIDTAAHTGCLKGRSPTAALLACGLDVDYPSENHRLKQKIIESGGVLLSEYPPGTPALSWRFPIRNRMIAALGRVVVLMEAQIRSGSMTTVQHALEQGKDVYAYPGNIDSEWATASHQLLREGATYFTSARDILEDLNWNDRPPAPEPEKKSALPPMTESQRKICALLSRQEMSFDQLADATRLDAPALSGDLTMLTILGLIRSMPGKLFGKA